ncbi:MAG: hypothetical protein M9921_08990 [Fimbriimonadaceae bacterium]|nr:hypothetical protein [Fimbriimonadaceae bacterium]
MRLTPAITLLPLCALAITQQGGNQGPRMDATTQTIDRLVGQYLNGDENKSILTPGEYNEWPLKLKAGQVVFAEARSDAFDPALEVVDDQGKVLASNDDRYPGDQRPLLMWRCGGDGDYALRVRSYNNKAGGQFFSRHTTYVSLDVPPDTVVEGVVEATKPFLVRIPMQAGQVKDLVAEKRGQANYINFNFGLVIVPNGLPERSPSFAAPISPAIRALIAPAPGDYYVMANPYGYRGGNGRVRIGTRTIVPNPLSTNGATRTGSAPTNTPALWEVSVKAGDLLEATAPHLHLDCALMVAEAPDFSGVDLSKPETNPLIPQWKGPSPGEAFDLLPARARDNRRVVFRARRDAKLWIATNAAGPADQSFSLTLKPAAAEFVEGKPNTGSLRIGDNDYWSFDAQAGDVMSLEARAVPFAQQIVVRDPDLAEIRRSVAAPDQTSDSWRMTVQKPGRYLVAVACLGDGGGGAYALDRTVFHSKEFGRTTAAKGTIGEGEIQVWKFTATPDAPLLVHWASSSWEYGVAIYDEKGRPSDFQRQQVDEHNRYGILKVDETRTYVIVLTGKGAKAEYSIALGPIPGGGKQ